MGSYIILVVLSTISPADVRLKCIASAVYLKTLARQGVGGQLKIPLKSRNAGFKPAHLPFYFLKNMLW
jgi:hypothetical protein